MWLDDDRALDAGLVGPKAASLARLRRSGFVVPDGFVLVGEPTGGLAAALAALGGPVAVRSSSLGEDGADVSAAGRFPTVLRVEGPEAVRAAVARCRAAGGFAMPVLVQRLVEAEVAGVAFSADPVTGDRDRVRISAVRGLGDRLAGGEADPDEGVPDPVLTVEITALARRVEAALGGPVDVEWARADGVTHVVQARPITALPVAPAIEVPPGTWLKDLAHYPDLVDPFSASFLLELYDEPVAAMCAEFGLLVERVESRCFGGEVYTRAVPPGGRDSPPPPWWLLAIVARLVPALRRRLRAAGRAVASGLLDDLPRRWETAWRESFRAENRALAEEGVGALADADLLAHVDRVVDLIRRGATVHFRLFVPYLDAVHGLVTACAELLGWDAAAALELVSGTSSASSEPARDLLALAETARARPERLEDALPAYLERHGLRSLGYTVGAPTLGERPDLLRAMVRDAIAARCGEGLRGVESGRLRRTGEARARLQGPGLDRFERVLARALRVYPVREDNVHWTTTLPIGLLRRAALEVGRRLVERGRLDRPHDVVMLARAEAVAALRGGTADLRAIAGRRRAERAWTAAHPGPPVLGPEAGPPPDLRGLPAAARRLNGVILWARALELQPPVGEPAGALRGVPGSPGRYRGPVRVVRSEADFDRVRPGDVLVCPIATPAWSVLFAHAGALVTDGGGPLSHAAIVAREHGLPAVLGTARATRELADGDVVTVDGTAATVSRAT